MARLRRGRVVLFFWRIHPYVYRATRGVIGRRIGLGMPVLLLDTVGRKTGARRTSAIGYVPDGDRYVLIGSNQGHVKNPAWVYNLRANPEATVQVGARKRRVRAREADGDERERLWRRAVDVYPGFELYKERAGSRHIPVVVLEPA